MKVKFDEIEDAFNFINSMPMGENMAYVDKETGRIYWYSGFGGFQEEDLPENVEDVEDLECNEQYIVMPHKNDLDMGRRLVFDFVRENLSEDAGRVEAFFRRSGAYARYKDLLERKGLLEKWYEYENTAQEKALRAWCEEEGIELV